MHYLLLIYENEKRMQQMSSAEKGQEFGLYRAFSDGIRKTDQMRGGNALHPTTSATTVRVREGKTLVTDGPFAETKEQLGGYYLIEAANLDEATAIAARIPGAKSGSIEVRPVIDM